MKSQKKWAIVFSLFLAFVFGVIVTLNFRQDRLHYVHVSDPALRIALQLEVYDALFPSSGDPWLDATNAEKLPLSEEGLACISSLTLEDFELTSTDGLQYCTNITELVLARCGIQDISFLQALKHLQTLDLSGNDIWDIRILSQYKFISRLNLNNNQILDIAPLAGLTSNELSLNDNRIHDMSPIALNPSSSLHISWNQITEVPPLHNMSLNKIAISNNPLSPESCQLLRDYELAGTIPNIIYNCPEEEHEVLSEMQLPTGVVFTADDVYHASKECQTLKGKDIGAMNADTARKKRMTLCKSCF